MQATLLHGLRFVMLCTSEHFNPTSDELDGGRWHHSVTWTAHCHALYFRTFLYFVAMMVTAEC
jgi:hypothetical protein